MTALSALWLPILLSAVIVFVVSSVVHMVLPWHKSDYPAVPDQDALLEAVRPFNLQDGDYMVPRAGSMAEMRSEAFKAKFTRGPLLIVTVIAKPSLGMGKQLVQWFIYLVVVAIFAAYVACHALASGAPYLQVFRFVGAVAFAGFALGLWQLSIWYRRGFGLTFKSTIDALLYACLMAGTFGWLWPR